MNDTKEVKSPKMKIESKKTVAVVNPHKVLTGKVVSTKRMNTIGVSIERVMTHRKYGKQMKRSTTLAVHNDTLTVKVGDTVQIEACRPISKTKHYKVIAKV